MPTEFDDDSHYAIFATAKTLTSETGLAVRWSEVILSALKSAGVFDQIEIGTTAPADTNALWLDKNTDPATLKLHNGAWVQASFQTLFGSIGENESGIDIDEYRFVATAGQSVFSGLDANSNTLSYVPGSIFVTQNGDFKSSSDYTATDGASVTLGAAATSGDVVTIQVLTGASGTPAVTSVAGKTGAVELDKADVGLSAVDNTSDADKPISTATQAALDQLSGGSMTDAQIETAYNNQVPAGTKTDLLTGSSTLIRRWSASVLMDWLKSKIRDLLFPPQVFHLIDYIAAIDAVQAEKVVNNDETQDASNVTEGVQNAIQAAVEHIRDNLPSRRGTRLVLPDGVALINDEIINDATQQIIWETGQGNLTKRRLDIQGPGSGNFAFKLSGFAGAVRNTAHGGNRSHGPWAGGPSPRAAIPLVAGGRTGNPLCFTLRGFSLEGEGSEATDPIGLLMVKTLNARVDDVRVSGFANSGLVKMGDYNSEFTRCTFENCSTILKTQGGQAAVGSTGDLPNVALNFTKTDDSNIQVTVADGSTTYFNSNQIGKTFLIHKSASLGGAVTMGKWTITGVPNATTANMNLQGTGAIAAGSTNGVYGSFECVVGSMSADGSVLTLKDPIRIGSNADDMIGRLVGVVGAGSKQADLYTGISEPADSLVALITGVGGAEGSGYTQITLSHPAKYEVTDAQVILNAGLWCSLEEGCIEDAIANGYPLYNHNDMDFSHCRFEGKGRQLFISRAAGANQLVACKWHGGTLDYANFGGEGCIVFDNVRGTDFIGCQLTYQAYFAGCQIYCTGDAQQWTFTGGGGLAWQVYADQVWIKQRPTNYTASKYRIEVVTTPEVSWNDYAFPNAAYGQAWHDSIVAATAVRLLFDQDGGSGGGVGPLVVDSTVYRSPYDPNPKYITRLGNGIIMIQTTLVMIRDASDTGKMYCRWDYPVAMIDGPSTIVNATPLYSNVTSVLLSEWGQLAVDAYAASAYLYIETDSGTFGENDEIYLRASLIAREAP